MKTAILMTLLLSLAACAPKSDAGGSTSAGVDALSMPTATTLKSRTKSDDNDNYSEAAYSLQYGSHDPQVTRNDYDLLYQGGQLQSIMVTDDLSQMMDLGSMSCADIPNRYQQTGKYPGKGHGGYPFAEDRKLDPLFWFNYTDVMDQLQKGPTVSSLAPIEGHCYVLNKVTRDRRVLALFRVSKVVANESISIDQIEVIERQTFAN